jgi:hypothetical protein
VRVPGRVLLLLPDPNLFAERKRQFHDCWVNLVDEME